MFLPSLTVLASLALLTLSTDQVNAQTTSPTVTGPISTVPTGGLSPPLPPPGPSPSTAGFADFSYIDGQVLYLGDGTYSGNQHMFTFVSEFYALDLTTAWTTASPAWKSLNRLTDYSGMGNGPLAATPDGKSVFFFPVSGTRRYDVATNQYTNETFVDLPTNYGISGITMDTDSGQIYDYGYSTPTGDWNITVFDPVKNTASYQTLPDGPNENTTMTTVYSSAKKSLFTFKAPYVTGVSQLNQYDLVAKTFKPVVATGDIPSPRSMPCFVSANNGTKLIVAGGAMDVSGNPGSVIPNLALDDVYMLDVASMVWTKMASMPSKYYGAVCAASGDSFIIWGGYNIYSSDQWEVTANWGGPAILDMKANTWGTSYTPPSKTTTGGNSGSSGGGSGNGALGLSAKSSMAGFLAITAATLSLIM
ncbi:hypothetical protein EMPS_08532 [Entomortierella parvispora]|uniref:Kelch repeat-containing protein n=1 Tax=Entomortierella parvispora TaxID=205924 RepID=A0A9P3HGV5_9FUNG|nr:hypothetical protein EMPS_08532 [Entomortierella parvispora]